MLPNKNDYAGVTSAPRAIGGVIAIAAAAAVARIPTISAIRFVSPIITAGSSAIAGVVPSRSTAAAANIGIACYSSIKASAAVSAITYIFVKV
jgi:hypothetical protein